MPDPGKGGKGLDKGGTKHHQKFLEKIPRTLWSLVFTILQSKGDVKHISGVTYEETPGAQRVSGECDWSCGDLQVVCQAQDGLTMAVVCALKRQSHSVRLPQLTSRLHRPFLRPPNKSRKESLILPSVWMSNQNADRYFWWSVPDATESSKVVVEATALEGVSELQA